MEQLVAQMKALGDENRFRIMMMLQERPLCSCEMLEVLEIAGGTLSAHLKVLKEAGLLSQKKKGRWILCGFADSKARKLVEYLAGMVGSETLFDSDSLKIRNTPPATDIGCSVGSRSPKN